MKSTYTALVALLLFAFGIYFYLTRVPTVDDRSGFDLVSWPPDTAEMCRLAGTNGTDPNTPAGLAARARYLVLFKKRYRDHAPMMAVGLRFPRSGRLDLLTPARMEPWSMDRLAFNTWREAQAAFGHSFDIDLFITYIGARPLKIGELRRSKDSPDKVEIVHFARPMYPSRERGVAVRN